MVFTIYPSMLQGLDHVCFALTSPPTTVRCSIPDQRVFLDVMSRGSLGAAVRTVFLGFDAVIDFVGKAHSCPHILYLNEHVDFAVEV